MSIWGFLGTMLATAIVVGITVAVLSIETIVNWFRERLGNRNTTNRLAVTVMQSLRKGDYKVVQGVFNTATREFESQRTVEASEIDSRFLAAHNEDGIAVWSL